MPNHLRMPDAPLPPFVGRALADPLPPRMPWYRGIAPAYLNLFIWAPFFDQLWAGRQAASGITWLVVDALLGSLICFGLYLAAASWGLQCSATPGRRRELDVRRDRSGVALWRGRRHCRLGLVRHRDQLRR